MLVRCETSSCSEMKWYKVVHVIGIPAIRIRLLAFQDRARSRSPRLHPVRRSAPLPAGVEGPEARQLDLALTHLLALLGDALGPDHHPRHEGERHA